MEIFLQTVQMKGNIYKEDTMKCNFCIYLLIWHFYNKLIFIYFYLRPPLSVIFLSFFLFKRAAKQQILINKSCSSLARLVLVMSLGLHATAAFLLQQWLTF